MSESRPHPAARNTGAAEAVRATARLQFHKDFTLDAALPLVSYLSALGISHIYASPLLTSRPGSTHGYDIVDHSTIDPELGGEAALRRLITALRGAGMGLILDIVPNHMGVGGADNAWWLDVLEWGRSSRFATYFDIDWDPPDPALKGKLLAPFLGAAYGECLQSGDLKLRFDQADGRFFIDYGGNRFPLNPHSYASILQMAGPAFATSAADFLELDRIGGREAQRLHAEQARRRLRELVTEAGLDDALSKFTPQSGGGDRLHRLLERQFYRLAWWRAASDEINWRRFFDVNSLAGLRVEQPEVFEDAHRTIFRLYAEGLIDGVRIDHVDGLADPRGYCRKLRRRLQAEAEKRPRDLPREPAIIWVEKILANGERLPRDWLTDGTTGYDFMNDVSALLHDPAGEARLTALWSQRTGRSGVFEDEAKTARRQILRESLSSELWATAAALQRVARRRLETRDYTLTGIRRALEEILVNFIAYRIYAGRSGLSESDRQVLNRAVAGARRTLRSADLPLLDHLQDWLSGDGIRSVPVGTPRSEWLRAMVRFQQLSAPTAAKSVEDTAFYRYGRLLSRNEVGSEPTQFALSQGGFHAICAGRRKFFPRTLLTTATHDHKRGEDTRARIAALSELPDEWETATSRWMRLNAPLKREVDDLAAPDEADEMMLYQMIVGAWPLELAPDDETGIGLFRERLRGWQEKAIREAKRRSEWAKPNDAYEAACAEFLRATLDPSRAARIAQEMADFAARLAPIGALNGLAQTVLRMTTPGIPDLYQGAEYWDFSLVDPDNRRPVEYEARLRSLDEHGAPADLMSCWQDGRVKQAIIARTLGFRRDAPELFALGTYERIEIEGPLCNHALAFLRRYRRNAMLVVISRLAAPHLGAGAPPVITEAIWQETNLSLPRFYHARRMRDVLGSMASAASAAAGGRIVMSTLLNRLPVAVIDLS